MKRKKIINMTEVMVAIEMEKVVWQIWERQQQCGGNENCVGQRVVMVAVEILEWASDDGGDNIGDNVVMMVVEKRTR